MRPYPISILLWLSVIANADENITQDDPARNSSQSIIVYGLDGAASQVVKGIERDTRIAPDANLVPFFDQQRWGWAPLWSGLSTIAAPEFGNFGEVNATLPKGELADSIPKLDATYFKTSFNGLFFSAHFQRKIWGPWGMGLRTQSRKIDSSSTWEYQASAHQPYLSLGRDSITLPLHGRNLYFHHFGWSPEINWNFGEAYKGSLSYHSWSLAADWPIAEEPVVSLSDPRLQRQFKHNPWKSSEDESHWLFENQGQIANLFWNAKQLWGSRDNFERGLDSVLFLNPSNLSDTSRFKSSQRDSSTRSLSEFELGATISEQTDLGLHALNQWTLWQTNTNDLAQYGHRLYEDQQRFWLSASHRSKVWKIGAELGLGRSSDVFDRQEISPLGSLQAQWNKPSFEISAASSFQNINPNAKDLFKIDLGQMRFANPDLQSETRMEYQGQAKFLGPFYHLGTGISGRYTDQALAPLSAWNLYNNASSGIVNGSSLFNFDNEQRLIWEIGGGLRLGHWASQVHREQFALKTLSYDKKYVNRKDLPGAFWKGNLVWRDTLLHKKSLDLEVRWDWQWYGSYQDVSYDFVKGNVYRIDIEDELMLDFEVRARIQTFQLFAQIRNMAHEYLRSEPGFTTPGLHLQWGLSWSFDS